MSARSIDSLPIIRSRSSRNDERFVPANFIDDKTTALIGDCKSKLIRIADSFQAVAASKLPRIGTEEIGLARAKAKKERSDAIKIFQQMPAPHGAESCQQSCRHIQHNQRTRLRGCYSPAGSGQRSEVRSQSITAKIIVAKIDRDHSGFATRVCRIAFLLPILSKHLASRADVENSLSNYPEALRLRLLGASFSGRFSQKHKGE